MEMFEERVLLDEWDSAVRTVHNDNSAYWETLFSPTVINAVEKLRWINPKAKKFYEEKRNTPAEILTPKQKRFRYGINATILTKAGNVVEWYKIHNPQDNPFNYKESVAPSIPPTQEEEKPRLKYPKMSRRFPQFKHGKELRNLREQLFLQQKDACRLFEKKHGIKLSQSVLCRVEKGGCKGVRAKVKKALTLLLKDLREMVEDKNTSGGFGPSPNKTLKKKVVKADLPKPSSSKSDLERTISQLKQQPVVEKNVWEITQPVYAPALVWGQDYHYKRRSNVSKYSYSYYSSIYMANDKTTSCFYFSLCRAIVPIRLFL